MSCRDFDVAACRAGFVGDREQAAHARIHAFVQRMAVARNCAACVARLDEGRLRRGRDVPRGFAGEDA